MNESLQNKLSEVVGTNNISYILEDNQDFSITGYKVMQNQRGSGLLRCAKIMYNGKIKLVYMIGNSKPLSYVATRMGVNELNAVILNLIQRVMDIKANGFFEVENLELDVNKIFVDMSDYSVHLIYFPLSGDHNGNLSAFENEFRVVLIKLFNSFPVFNAPQFQRLCSDLANGSLPLDMIMKKMQEGISTNIYSRSNYENHSKYSNQDGNTRTPSVNQNAGYGNQNKELSAGNSSKNNGYQVAAVQGQQPIMTVTAVNSPMQLVLTVNQPEYLIGKHPGMVNGVVTYNPAISRVHCKITFAQGRYYLTDMDSANGTFINQQRLEKYQMVQLNNGDYLKLANSDFIVSF